jgi:uncharacterized metal-binding protein YceD (DUF177 family)
MNEREPRDTKPDRKKSARIGLAADAVQPWSFPVPLAEIPAAGRHVELTADAATCEAVAKAAGVVAVSRLQAKFDLAPLAGEGVKVFGSVLATIEQECVVTLEPLRNEIDEPVDLILVQPDALPPPRPALDIDVAGETDMPDLLHDRAVDLGAIATEFLLLGIDPYPRKPGASFETPQEPDSPAQHPFAVLAALKKDSGGKAD